MRYFDFANHEYVKKIVRMYFDKGYPYEPHLSAITVDLSDLRIMRNASAHISSSTQVTLEGLALRIFQQPVPGITLYQMLTMLHPNAGIGQTVFSVYKDKLIAG